MTDQQIRLFRDGLLNTLLAGDCSVGLDVACVTIGARALGFPKIAPEETVEHLEYLTEHGFAREVEAKHTKVIRHWRITDAGRRLLD
jgi:hypothetical protein